jgi:ketosteroid isomerase-like protein
MVPGSGTTTGHSEESTAPSAVENVRTYYELVDRGRIDELLNLFAEDSVYERPGYPPMRGRQALEDFYRKTRIIEDGRHMLTSVTQEGDSIAVTGRFEGELKNNSQVSLEFADFFDMDPKGTFRHRKTFFFTSMV